MRLVVAAVLAQGCGTSILLSYPTQFPFLRAHNEIVIASRALEDPMQTTRAHLETGPLRVACETTTVVPKVEATWFESFDGVGRIWCGFMAVSEGTGSLALALDGKGDGASVAAALLGADALGALVYAIVAEPSSKTWKTIGPGSPEVSQACPAGLAVRVADRTWAVEPDGSLAGDRQALASAALAGQPLAIAGGGVEVAWSPDARDRCALAAEFGLDDASCRAPPAAVAATPEPVPVRVVVPLEFHIRLHVR